MQGPPFGPTLALTIALALGAVMLLICGVTSVVKPTPIPGLGASQRQHAESGMYIVSLGIVLLSSLVVAPRLAEAIARGANARVLSPLAAIIAASLALVVLGSRAIDAVAGGGTGVLLAATLAWAIAAAAAIAAAVRDRESTALTGLARHTRRLWVLAAVLGAATPLVVTHPRSISVAPVVLGAAVIALCALRTPPTLRGRAGLAVDAALVVLLVLVIPDMVVVRPEDPGLSELDHYLASIMQFHHDFLVGPANQVLGGDTLLRDTASQYGVGSVYFLVGWFKIMTISYGSFALLDGVLTAALYACAYAVLRMAGCSRALAGSAMAVAVVALVFNRLYAVGMLPQEGPFRFGLPMGVVVAAVAAVRWPARARLASALALVVIGVSAIWSLEAFAATVGVFVVLAVLATVMRPRGDRVAFLARQVLLAAGAAVAAQVLFAVATLVGTGDLPAWGQYLAFLHEFLFGGLGELTYDFARWSVGLGLGAAYLGSATALLLLLRLRPRFAADERVSITAIAGTTAYGLVQFAYFVDRSADHVAVYVALPAVMAGALWLGLILRAPAVSRELRTGAVVVTGVVAVLLVSVGWSAIERPLSRSALSQLLPGGDSPRGALDRLRAFPAIDPSAPEGERLLDTTMPGERRSIVLTRPDLTVEVLIRRGRANALPISDAREDDLAFDERLPGILDAVGRLAPGRRMLVDGQALATLATVRRNPHSAVLKPGNHPFPAVEAQALRAIDRRFRLRIVERGSGGLVVLQLDRRRSR